MALFLLMVMLTLCAASPQDLSGKMFTFPEPSNSAHVRLTTSRQVLRAVTVCLRFFTDLNRDHGLFSLTTPGSENELLIFNSVSGNTYNYYVKNKGVDFMEQHYKLNTWHSICSTWDSESGLGQLWLDGKPSSRKFISSGSSINGPIIIVLGQEQDNHGGGFDVQQCFVGMMSDVHMWDYTLSPCEIQNYMHHVTFPPGNVLNWGTLEFQTTGRVLIEEKQGIKNCT
ncbi:C-reactive protein [Etheostoma spectabile]|uniref:C-reactive protein n=1 Tax=Etheostoma spectabile TaxID=54343 RepID=UPI0013AE8A36|nr:C-reactive protein-like [Etheostoma spectabile]